MFIWKPLIWLSQVWLIFTDRWMNSSRSCRPMRLDLGGACWLRCRLMQSWNCLKLDRNCRPMSLGRSCWYWCHRPVGLDLDRSCRCTHNTFYNTEPLEELVFFKWDFLILSLFVMRWPSGRRLIELEILMRTFHHNSITATPLLLFLMLLPPTPHVRVHLSLAQHFCYLEARHVSPIDFQCCHFLSEGDQTL